jgi:hypothetical protein
MFPTGLLVRQTLILSRWERPPTILWALHAIPEIVYCLLEVLQEVQVFIFPRW